MVLILLQLLLLSLLLLKTTDLTDTIMKWLQRHVAHSRVIQRWRQENSSGGPSFSLGADPAPPSPPHPSLPPFPSLPSPPLPSTLVLSPPLRSRPPKIHLGGLGERCKLPQWGLGGPTNDLVHFSLKIWHLVATILIISSIVKRLLWRASPVARGEGRFYSGGQAPLSPTGAGAGVINAPRMSMWQS